MYMYMSSWLTTGIHVHVPCRGSFGFTAGEADRWLPPLSCATRHVRDWTEFPQDSGLGALRGGACHGSGEAPSPGLPRTVGCSRGVRSLNVACSTRNPASPQQNSTYLKVPATLASHRPAKQHLPEGFSHPCHQDLQRGLLNPVEEKLSSEGSSTRNPASPQQNMDL